MTPLPHDQVIELQRRVERLEGFALRALAWLTAVVLAAGLVLPYLPAREGAPQSEGPATGDHLDSLLTAGFQAFAWRNAEDERGGQMVAIGIGFLGLLAVVVVALGLLYVLGTRTAGARTAGLVRACAVLLTIGTVIAALLLWIANAGEDGGELDAGWGVGVLAVGAVLFWTFLSDQVRGWWDDPASRR